MKRHVMRRQTANRENVQAERLARDAARGGNFTVCFSSVAEGWTPPSAGVGLKRGRVPPAPRSWEDVFHRPRRDRRRFLFIGFGLSEEA